MDQVVTLWCSRREQEAHIAFIISPQIPCIWSRHEDQASRVHEGGVGRRVTGLVLELLASRRNDLSGSGQSGIGRFIMGEVQ